jgi:hypothetical protein
MHDASRFLDACMLLVKLRCLLPLMVLLEPAFAFEQVCSMPGLPEQVVTAWYLEGCKVAVEAISSTVE